MDKLLLRGAPIGPILLDRAASAGFVTVAQGHPDVSLARLPSVQIEGCTCTSRPN